MTRFPTEASSSGQGLDFVLAIMRVEVNDSLALLAKVTNGCVAVLSKLLRQPSVAQALRIATVFRRLASRRGKN